MDADALYDLIAALYEPPPNVPDQWREGPPADSPHMGEAGDWSRPVNGLGTYWEE